MPKYQIGRSYGYAGDEEFYEVEADNQGEAEDIAWQWAVERVDSWAEEMIDETK